jgi:tRNA(Ile)-lysidine synthase
MSKKNNRFGQHALRHYLPQHKSAGRYLVALSGGLDSMCLLDALLKSEPAFEVVAIHVHHGLSPNADAWSQHCANFCQQAGIGFIEEKVSVINSGKGIEDAAREARYSAFAQHIESGDHLLMAHHADDQAETLLLRLLRGTGAKGLEGMAQQRAFFNGIIWRPLLTFSRASLEAYAARQALRWVEDESNADSGYDRNFLRNNIFPLLNQRWPDFALRWQQTATQIAEANQLAELTIQQLFPSLEPRSEKAGTSINVEVLQQYSLAERTALLRYWSELHGFDAPGAQPLAILNQHLHQALPDHNFELCWGGAVLKRFQQRLYLYSSHAWQTIQGADEGGAQSKSRSLSLATCQQISVFAGMQLCFEAVKAASGDACLAAHYQNIRIVRRQGGERCHPHCRAHSQTLKKLLQASDMEPWWRDQIPLLLSEDGQLLAVGDLWVEKSAMAASGEPGWRIFWRETANIG